MTTEGSTGHGGAALGWTHGTLLAPRAARGERGAAAATRHSFLHTSPLQATALLSQSPNIHYFPSLSPSSTGLSHASLPKLHLLASHTVCDVSPLSSIFRRTVHSASPAPTSSSQWWFFHATLLSPFSAPWDLEGHPAALGTAPNSLSNASHSPGSSHLPLPLDSSHSHSQFILQLIPVLPNCFPIVLTEKITPEEIIFQHLKKYFAFFLR